MADHPQVAAFLSKLMFSWASSSSSKEVGQGILKQISVHSFTVQLYGTKNQILTGLP